MALPDRELIGGVDVPDEVVREAMADGRGLQAGDHPTHGLVTTSTGTGQINQSAGGIRAQGELEHLLATGRVDADHRLDSARVTDLGEQRGRSPRAGGVTGEGDDRLGCVPRQRPPEPSDQSRRRATTRRVLAHEGHRSLGGPHRSDDGDRRVARKPVDGVVEQPSTVQLRRQLVAAEPA